MNEQLKKDPSVIHCKVKVTSKINPKTGAEEYSAVYDPKVIRVTENDTTLIFKLSDKTPKNILIESITPVQEQNTQLSQASISRNQRSATMSDINTMKEDLNLVFKFTNQDDTAKRSTVFCSEESGVYPEIDNDPPIPPM